MNASIIGLDPGSRITGFGVLVKRPGGWSHAEHGVVQTPEKISFAERLAFIARELRPVFKRWPGATTVVERIFLGKNPDSAFKLGHARGICLLLAAESGSPVFEYAARSVKKIVTGQGGADKEHVRLVVTQWLKTTIEGRMDASDALALAICHTREMDRLEVLSRLKEMQP
jgi:crossover junction endodeoxyribonuclease RuvC